MLHLFTLFLVAVLFLDTIVNSSNPQTCQNALEDIAFYPQNCASRYLFRLSQEFATQRALIFNPETRSQTIFNFEQKYNVVVTLLDPFGVRAIYDKTTQRVYVDVLSLIPVVNLFYPAPARSFLNLGSYANNPGQNQNVYRFQIFSKDAEYFNVIFTASSKEFFC